MAPRRLPISRLTGIAAWTAASVAWGTAIVAAANVQPVPLVAEPDAVGSSDSPTTTMHPEQLAALPTMPENGLVVVRFTPTELPAPKVTIRRVATSPATSTPAPAPATRETSSGS